MSYFCDNKKNGKIFPIYNVPTIRNNISSSSPYRHQVPRSIVPSHNVTLQDLRKPANHYTYEMVSPTVQEIVCLCVSDQSSRPYHWIICSNDRWPVLDWFDLELNPWQYPQRVNIMHIPDFNHWDTLPQNNIIINFIKI